MVSPTLSIVTPSYNQVDYIEDCLQSVRDREYDDMEHIVVDGGSTDGTVDVLKRYENDYNLRWVSERDSGQSNAINKGIRMADGDWIGWQNSDDFYLKDAFKRFEAAKRNNPEADLIYGDVIVVGEGGKKLRRLYQTCPSKFVHRYWSLFARNQATFFSQRVFNEIGYLNEDFVYTMDEDLFWRVLKADLHLVNIPEPLGAFRVQAEGKTQQRGADAWSDERRKIYDRTFFDSILPRRVLGYFAKIVKGIQLIRDRRWSAFR
jgi:glycosyltransferase involved in cell wall biosynthesis